MFRLVLLFIALNLTMLSSVYAEGNDRVSIDCPNLNITGLILSGAVQITAQELESSKVKQYLIRNHAYDRVQDALASGGWIHIAMRSDTGESGLIVSVQNSSLWYLWTTDAEMAKLDLQPGHISETSQFLCENKDLFIGEVKTKEKEAI